MASRQIFYIGNYPDLKGHNTRVSRGRNRSASLRAAQDRLVQTEKMVSLRATHRRLLSAAKKNIGDKVEIRIRGNGTGIQRTSKKEFNPSFTIPPGEGTRLGLSMSRDIVVRQYRGSIDVETKLGLP
jgi:signal transduction histidine kinase